MATPPVGTAWQKVPSAETRRRSSRSTAASIARSAAANVTPPKAYITFHASGITSS